MSEVYANGRTYDEHCAWLASLEGDEALMVHTPVGHLFSLALVSVIRRALETVETTAGERLRLLDGIDGCIYGCVTPEAVAAVQAANSDSAEMMRAITSLHPSQQMTAFQRGGVFRLMSQLNPSLRIALRLCNRYAFPTTAQGAYNG